MEYRVINRKKSGQDQESSNRLGDNLITLIHNAEEQDLRIVLPKTTIFRSNRTKITRNKTIKIAIKTIRNHHKKKGWRVHRFYNP